ncbi:MAG: DUF1156 domain-containing protein [Candidatus Paceibacterota bacterium]
MTKYRKKLIEVALPLEAINKESAREKSIRHGHPSTLHLWWARRPLAACRAVLFSSLVNDPEDDPMYGIDKDIAYTERAKLFNLIEELVKWENSNNPRVINAARLEIARSIAANKVADKELKDDTPLVANAPKLPDEQEKYLPDPPPEYTPYDVRFKMPSLRPEQVNHFLAHYAPPVLDPFAGGGSIPLEAQRLGLRAHASDLNPVPVLINKALIEIPPKFAGLPPVNPESQIGNLKSKIWHGAQGLADDVRYYGQWMRDEAEKRIGHLYPKVKVIDEMAADRPDLEPYIGKELNVIAWLWARTIECPNPACRKRTPLLPSFWLSIKKGQETFADPVVSGEQLSFRVRRNGKVPDPTSSRSGATCLFCERALTKQQLRDIASETGTDAVQIGVCCDAGGSRIYVDSDAVSIPQDFEMDVAFAEQAITDDKRWFSPPLYGLTTFADVFTRRQLRMLTEFSELVGEARSLIHKHQESDRARGDAYSDAVATYLALGISKMTDYNSTLVTWIMQRNQAGHAFSKQAMPMIWYFAEVNPFVGAAGDLTVSLRGISKVIEAAGPCAPGSASQVDASTSLRVTGAMVCTDPPYYDNIGYADLSDFFYIWLRRCLSRIYPNLLSTVLTPKGPELIAASHRHGGSKRNAQTFFEDGLGIVFTHINDVALDEYPATIFYAFKQAETSKTVDGLGVSSTGWETMLAGLIRSGFAISGTWPMRTERESRSVGMGTNALASSIILVCRK